MRSKENISDIAPDCRAISTILDKVIADFFTFKHNFFSPQVKRNKIVITRKWMYELSNELPNNLRNLREIKKILEMLRFNGVCSAGHIKAKFWRCFLVKNCKKSALKHSRGKPVLLNFVNLSANLCPRL